MVNLTPESTRELVAVEFRFRLMIVLCAGASAIFSMAAVLLLPAYYFSGVMKDTVEKRTSSLGASTTEQEKDLANDEKIAQTLYASITTLEKEARPSLVMENILAVSKKGIHVETIDYKTTPKTSLQLNGYASTREVLLSYKQALSEIPGIATVTLPLNDLAKPTDTDFSLLITFSSAKE